MGNVISTRNRINFPLLFFPQFYFNTNFFTHDLFLSRFFFPRFNSHIFIYTYLFHKLLYTCHYFTYLYLTYFYSHVIINMKFAWLPRRVILKLLLVPRIMGFQNSFFPSNIRNQKKNYYLLIGI